MDCLIAICSTIVGEITKYAVAPIGRQFGYLFFYQRNIDNLRRQLEDLSHKKSIIERRVKEARRRDEETHEGVNKWLDEVEKSSTEAEAMLKDESHHKAKCSYGGSFPNLVMRHQLSRKIKKMAETIASEIQKADTFQNIASLPALKSPFENRDFEVFDTRTTILRDIMEALKNPNYSKIGVYGIGGSGKTMLVTEVARKARDEEKIFNEVVVVTVSQSFNLKNVQKEIAEKLGLPLEEEILSTRADRLQHRLKGEKNILIIFDDIWRKFELKDVGISFDKDGQKGCKILLVSRYRYVLSNDMGVEKNIEVGVLSLNEAMTLFNRFVGGTSGERYYKGLADAIVRQCGGLPITLVPIASALKNREIFVWEDILNKLKRSPREGYEKAYPSIRTSYEFLKTDQEKLILLLCSQHEEEINISVENLMGIYGAYSDMFQDEDTLEKARISVLASIDNLKGCSLLLNGHYDGTVKLHAVIRQIMISIAMEDETRHMYCFENFKSLVNSVNHGKLADSTAISLLGSDFHQLPENLACPRLKLLLIHRERYMSSDSGLFPTGFFEGAKELRALCLRFITLRRLLLSSSPLQNLQTLSLQQCVLEDLAFIGELKNLAVLDLSYSKFEHFPEQIKKLTCLRQLNLKHCSGLQVFRPNIISSLVKLEELYMDFVYIEWGMQEVGGKGTNASLVELKSLSQLKALHLYISDGNVLPKDLFVDGKLARFNIIVGSRIEHDDLPATSSRLLHLTLHEQSQLHEYGFQKLMKKSEVLYLGALPGVHNIVPQLDVDGFPELKKLYVKENDELQYIIESNEEIESCGAIQKTSLETLELFSLQNLEKILCGRFTGQPFGRLRRITVSECNKLKNILPYFVHNKIEVISVFKCNVVKEIAYLEKGNHATNYDNVEFPHLRSLNLTSLPNLTQFFSPTLETTDYHASFNLPLFNAKVAFPRLEDLVLDDINFSELLPYWLPTTSSMPILRQLCVENCKNLKYLAIVGSLIQLEDLRITKCSIMEEIIVVEKKEEEEEEEGMSSEKILFPKLRSLYFYGLASLKTFFRGNCPQLKTFTSQSMPGSTRHHDEEIQQPLFSDKVVFKNLQKLTIENCNSLLSMWSLATSESLQQLKELIINECELMKEVLTVTKEVGNQERKLKKMSFPKLEYLQLRDLPKLRRFCRGDCNIEFPSLLQLDIRNCFELRTFVAKSTCSTSRNEKEVKEREMAEKPLFNGKVVFKNLQTLIIEKCSSLLALAKPEGLQQLKKLIIKECELMEEVFTVTEEEGDDQVLKSKKMFSFPKLEYLQLYNLLKFKRFCQGYSTLKFGSLVELRICGCPELRMLIAKSTQSTSSIEKEEEEEEREMTEKAMFNRTVIFSILKRLRVTSCKNLKYLLPFAIAGSLMQLEELEVTDCSAMEEIVVDDDDQEEEGSSSRERLFPKLTSLMLERLENLRAFCAGDCNIRRESPSKLKIRDCPLFKTPKSMP